MAVDITDQGGMLKIDDGTNPKYYPKDDVRYEIKGAVLFIFHQTQKVHTFESSDITTPTGATLEDKADAIGVLLDVSGGGGGGDASAANQVLAIAELTSIEANTASSGQPAEETAFVTTALLADAATFDSGVIDAGGHTQVQTEITASHDGTIDISFCSDSGGTDVVRSLSIPYVAADGYQFFAAPAFVNFIKYEFTNDGGATQTDFYYTTKLLTTGLSPQLLTTGAFIASGMVAHLGRNIVVGEDVNGVFNNASVIATTNDAGTTHNLQVVSGARPSQLAGRLKVSEVVDTSVSVLQRTITASKTFFVTDIILTIDNTDNANTGEVKLRDGLTVAGAVVFPMLVAESPTNESVITTITHTFLEPIEFSTGLFIEEDTGINHVTGVLNGYEE